MNGQTLALNNNWLDSDFPSLNSAASNLPTMATATTLTTSHQNSLSVGTLTYQQYSNGWNGYPYTYWVTSPQRPIKLTLSEVERLRKAAKGDGKLKDILTKFTGQIEITVDFE